MGRSLGCCNHTGIYMENSAAESTKQCVRAYNKFVQDYPEYEIDVKLCAFGQSEFLEAKAVFECN